jgi:hypothetical protein
MSDSFERVDLKVAVDMVDRDGKARRTLLSVPCDIPVVERMPVIAECDLATGRHAIWTGSEGTTYRSWTEIACDRSGLGARPDITTPSRQAAHFVERDYTSRLPDRHAVTGEIFYDAGNREPLPWDPADFRGFDVSKVDDRIAELRRNAASAIAVHEGELHLARPLPLWLTSWTANRIELRTAETSYHRFADHLSAGGYYLATAFAADRLQDAHALLGARGNPGATVVEGSMRFLDPAYAPGSNLADVAGVICSWLVENLRVSPADLEGDLVRQWHDLSQGFDIARSEDHRLAAETLRTALRSVDAFEGIPDAWRGRGNSALRLPFWRTSLDRLAVEGIGPCRRQPAAPEPFRPEV